MVIGEKLRVMRVRLGLTQKEVADRCELSKGFISQIERDLASPSIATLKDILDCLGSSLTDFFAAKTIEKVVFTPAEMFSKADDESLKGSVTWLIPDAQKNSMEPILLTIGSHGKSQTLPPHEGEEFGYILKGSVIIVMGDDRIKMRRGDAFCVHPTCDHLIINESKTTAQVLWITDPPCF